ncbi:MAG: lytic transglycosylase domain-containing protein [Firmicutes bacterium]|nr:lytic transglycosylase domain-containing protein [Bacillota bacterium]
MGRARFFVVRMRSVLALLGLVIVLFVACTPAFLRRVYPIYYYPVIQQEASRMHVDPLLIAAVVRVESHFREDDVSHAGAVGLMQLMPNTARWIAGQMGQNGAPNQVSEAQGGEALAPGSADLANPQLNIRLGSWYMAYLLRFFHGRLPEAIAAYNAGPNRVLRWVQSDVWSGQEVTGDDIPVRETRHFLARVMYTYDIFKRFY